MLIYCLFILNLGFRKHNRRLNLQNKNNRKRVSDVVQRHNPMLKGAKGTFHWGHCSTENLTVYIVNHRTKSPKRGPMIQEVYMYLVLFIYTYFVRLKILNK